MTTTPAIEDVNLDIGIDLDLSRSERMQQREMKALDLPIRLGGKVVARIPTELPLPALAPLRQLDAEIALVLRSAMNAVKASRGGQSQEQWDATSLIVDVLVGNPDLPTKFVTVVQEMAVELMGRQGVDALMAERPSVPDVTALVQGVLKFYGMTLGESLPSSDSPTEEGETDGTTSMLTGPTTTPDSTSEESGPTPATPGSSAPDAS